MLADDWISADKYANKSFRSGRRTTGTLAAYYKHSHNIDNGIHTSGFCINNT